MAETETEGVIDVTVEPVTEGLVLGEAGMEEVTEVDAIEGAEMMTETEETMKEEENLLESSTYRRYQMP